MTARQMPLQMPPGSTIFETQFSHLATIILKPYRLAQVNSVYYFTRDAVDYPSYTDSALTSLQFVRAVRPFRINDLGSATMPALRPGLESNRLYVALH